MKLQMFALLDIKTGAYATPWFQPHAAQAIRAVMDLAGDPTTIIGRHPADFNLVLLGSWDDQTGQFEPVVPTVLGSCKSFLPAPVTDAPLFDAAPGGVRLSRASSNGMEPHGSDFEAG